MDSTPNPARAWRVLMPSERNCGTGQRRFQKELRKSACRAPRARILNTVATPVVAYRDRPTALAATILGVGLERRLR